ncbi:MAG: hypothetical protein IT379_17130 [Deltaproteobacteria bacterium]|nr:hypothetical protein [Deltaproteobacteria bacterium]
MDTPLHPAIVHLPLGLAIIVPLLAVALTVAMWRDWLPKRAWLAVVGLQVLLVATGVMALRTGEQDEERVERIVAEQVLEAHEEAAAVFVWMAAATLAASVVVLLLKSDAARRWVSVGTSLATLVVAVLGIRVGHAGGELVYRHGAAGVYAPAGPNAPAATGGAAAAEEEEER